MKINNIENWLKENRKTFLNSIEQTECKKWARWNEDNLTHIFPCVCPNRNPECIFIETYCEVQKSYYLIQKEQDYLEALEQYYKIKHNKSAVLEWAKYYEYIGEDILAFTPVIKIKIQQRPYKVKQIVLPEKEMQNLLKFQEIFTGYYYSEEYENY